jgi:hypothetical protein
LDPDLDGAAGFAMGGTGRATARGTTLPTGFEAVAVAFTGAAGRFAAAAGACAFGRAPAAPRGRAGTLGFFAFAERDAWLEVLGFDARVLRGDAIIFLP